MVLCFAMLAAWFETVSTAAETQRRHRVDDIFEVEFLESPVFSPDGEAVAFVRKRPRKTLPARLQTGLVTDDVRADVWLQDAPGRPPRNLTQGESDASGWWMPSWSPDGRRLAFFSSRGGATTLWMWDRETNKVRQLTSTPLDGMTSRYVVAGSEYFHWVDNQKILCTGADPDIEVSPSHSVEGLTMARAMATWTKAAKGGSTVSVVNSLEFNQPARRLILLDLAGKERVVGQILSGIGVNYAWGIRTHTVWLSPDRQTVAMVVPATSTYGADTEARIGFPRKIELHRLDGGPVPLKRPLPANILGDTVRWSQDGKEVAFFAYGDARLNPLILYGPAAAAVMPETDQSASLENPARLWRVDITQGSVEEIGTGDIDLGYLGAPKFRWTSAGELLFQAPRRQFGRQTLNPISRGGPVGTPIGPTPGMEWLILARDGSSRPLTTDTGHLPATLQSIDSGAALIGLKDGEIWKIDPTTGRTTNLTERLEPSVSLFSLGSRPERATRLLLATSKLNQRDATLTRIGQVTRLQKQTYNILDLSSGELRELTPPSAEARLLVFNDNGDSVVYSSSEQTGSTLWRVSQAKGVEPLAKVNAFYQQIIRPKSMTLEYRDADGRLQKVGLILPVDYKPERRVPLVVDVYHSTSLSLQEVDSDGNVSLPLLGSRGLITSAGYAYLRPSIPRNFSDLEKEEGDSIFTLSKTVLPAIDQAIAQGLIDPDRLFVAGWSNGGFSSVALVSQTARFKAALAGSGHYDRQITGDLGALGSSLYYRFAMAPHDTAMPSGRHKEAFPTDVPWWRDGDLIRRNSPYTYLDRIRTPILLTHGDMDVVAPYEQSDLLFKALTSQRKRVQFARYWGEGHGFTSSENIRDSWQRTFAWFDDFGDIARDSEGNIIYEGDKAKSRNGAPALTVEDFARFDFLAPVNTTNAGQTHQQGESQRRH